MAENQSMPTFLELPASTSTGKPPRIRVLPVPYEATVSYAPGTAHGPRAILEASSQLELYDRTFGTEPCEIYGIETLPAFVIPGGSTQEVTQALAQWIQPLIEPERLLVGLGGEHTITVGLTRGTARALANPITLVQIDAHGDLRDQYETEPYSHACVARRLLDKGVMELVLIGIRSLCTEEAEFISANDKRVHVHFAEDMHGDPTGIWRKDLAQQLKGRQVYLTIDVDGLDPSVIAATGTPEPNGLSWQQTVDAIDTVCRAAKVVGMDLVELAPRPMLHAADFATAKLAYVTMSHIARSRGWLA